MKYLEGLGSIMWLAMYTSPHVDQNKNLINLSIWKSFHKFMNTTRATQFYHFNVFKNLMVTQQQGYFKSKERLDMMSIEP